MLTTLPLAVLAVLFVAVHSRRTLPALGRLVVVSAVVLKIALISADEFYLFLPGRPDVEYFSNEAAYLSTIPFSKWGAYFGSLGGESAIGKGVFVTVYFLLGSIGFEPELAIAFVNTVVAYLITVLLLWIVREYGRVDKREANLITVVATVYPALFITSLYGLRDVIAAALFLSFVLGMVRISTQFQPSLHLASSAGALALRLPAVVPIAATALCWGFYAIRDRRSRVRALFASSLILAAVALAGKDILLTTLSNNAVLQILEQRSESFQRPFPINFQYSSILDLIIHGPERLFYFLFYPHFGTDGFTNYVFAKLDVAFNYIVVPVGVYMFARRMLRKKNVVDKDYDRPSPDWLFFASIGSLLSFAYFEIQFGGALRHRVPFIVMLIGFVFASRASVQMPYRTGATVRSFKRRRATA